MKVKLNLIVVEEIGLKESKRSIIMDQKVFKNSLMNQDLNLNNV